MIYDILLFMGMQFDDLFSTLLGFKTKKVKELNPLLPNDPLLLSQIKIGIAFLVLLIILLTICPFSKSFAQDLFMFDSILEAIVTLNNTLVIAKVKHNL